MSVRFRACQRLCELYRGIVVRLREHSGRVMAGRVPARASRGPLGRVSFLEALEPRVMLSATADDGSLLLAPREYVVDARPLAVAAADFNGDGVTDVATADDSSKSISVLLGQGDGTFAAKQTYQGILEPRSITAADINGDGVIDLATASRHDAIVLVLWGRGDGTFVAAQVDVEVMGLVFATVADLNGDEVMDLVTAGGGISVHLGQGNGTFAARQQYAVGQGLQCVIASDLNGDDVMDLVTADEGDNAVSVLLGQGDGTFAARQAYAVGDKPLSVTAADVNGDDVMDLVTADHGDNTVSVLLGQGDGTFAAKVGYAAGVDLHSVTATDLNGDGVLDLVATNTWDNTVSVLLGRGDGTFAAKQTYATGNNPSSAIAADVNGDGVMDLVTANTAYVWDCTVSVLLGRGDGTFATRKVYQVGSRPTSVAVADLNGDGAMDLVVTESFEGTILVLLGQNDGTFVPGQVYRLRDDAASVVTADINGDGAVDIVTTGNCARGVSILLGHGDGTFAVAAPVYGAGSYNYSVTVADLNGDGVMDLLTASAPYSTISASLGRGDGTFAAGQTYTVGKYPRSITAMDFNSDGVIDIATANAMDNAVAVLLGRGDGTFVAGQIYAVGNEPYAVTAADINGDGAADLITADHTYGTVSVLLGRGDGTFAARQVYHVGFYPTSVAVADFDGNGVMDLVTSDGGDDVVSVLPGQGDGTFAARQIYAVGDAPWFVTAADLNGDDAADVVTAEMYSHTISVLLGAKKFSGPSVVAVDDAVTVSEDAAIDIAVLANDSDRDGEVLGIQSFEQPGHGQVIDNGNGTLRYTPAANWFGQDSFIYIVSDGHGGTATGTVMVTVTAVNDAPAAADAALTAVIGDGAARTLTATDVDGEALTYRVVSGPEHGVVTLAADGTFTYTPSDYVLGQDRFTFVASDGQEDSTPATVNIQFTGAAMALDAKGRAAFTDASGDLVSVALSGGGRGTIYLASDGPNDARLVVLAGTTAKSKLTITTRGSGNSTTLGGLDTGGGALAAITARTTELQGQVRIGSGAAAALTFARVRESSIVSGSTIASLSIIDWLDSDAVADRIAAPGLGRLTVSGDKRRGLAGDFEADLDMGSAGASSMAVGDVAIAGRWDESVVTAAGADAKTGLSIRSLRAGRVGEVDVTAWGGIGTIATSDWESGLIEAGWVGSVTTKANKALGTAGHFGADLVLTGQAVPVRKATLGSVSIAGDLVGARWDVQSGWVGAVTVSGTVRQSVVRSGGDIKSITMGASEGSDFGAGVAMDLLASSRHVAVGDTAHAPAGTIGTFTVRGLKVARGTPIPRFFVDSCISARMGRLTLLNWDGEGGLFAPTGGVKSVGHQDTADKANGWVWPAPPRQISSGPGEFIHLI